MKVTVSVVEALMDVQEQFITHCQQYAVEEVKNNDQGFKYYVVTADDGSLQEVPSEYMEEVGWLEEPESEEEWEFMKV